MKRASRRLDEVERILKRRTTAAHMRYSYCIERPVHRTLCAGITWVLGTQGH
jgi:alkylated DNA repair dioxygenase AlkB